jgi:RNA polymerase sigma-54 factor
VEEQYMFLEKGISFLKPMNLLTIAEKLKLHESTISRSVQNKYIQTPRGIFELKFFSTNGLATAGGEVVSSQSIKSRIRELIDEENKSRPLSDQQIADQLEKEGFQISRRTVMKYREEIPL